VKIRLKSGTLNYLDQGNGPAVLLIHAFPLNHTMWHPQVAALAPRFRIIAPDIRGFGESLPATPWTIEEMCGDLAEFLDNLNVKTCAVAGLSMGGYIGLPFCLNYPDRVRQIILANTRARADNETEKAARTDMIAALEQHGAGILPDRMLPRLLQPNPSPEVVQLVRSIMANTSASAAIYAVMAMRDRPDCSTLLHQIKSPALVIAGEHDMITNINECRSIAEGIPGGRFVSIPGAGHLSNLENPQEFNRALTDFLV
jgi:pimeloyl-ACP methyl ester carboxylesterase